MTVTTKLGLWCMGGEGWREGGESGAQGLGVRWSMGTEGKVGPQFLPRFGALAVEGRVVPIPHREARGNMRHL